MPYRFFTIMAMFPESGEERLNGFLAAHGVTDVKREFVAAGQQSFWSICVHYQESGASSPAGSRKGKIDYREVLPPEEFALFSRLRILRKQIAEQEGIPVYGVFTNGIYSDRCAKTRFLLATKGESKLLPLGNPQIVV